MFGSDEQALSLSRCIIKLNQRRRSVALLLTLGFTVNAKVQVGRTGSQPHGKVFRDRFSPEDGDRLARLIVLGNTLFRPAELFGRSRGSAREFLHRSRRRKGQATLFVDVVVVDDIAVGVVLAFRIFD